MLPLGCWGSAYMPPGNGGAGGGGGASASSTTTTNASSSGSGNAGGGGADSGPPPGLLCPTTFSFTPSGAAQNIRVAGEWQGFDLATAPVMTGPNAGVYSVEVKLPPGLHGYKLVYDDAGNNTNWILDPGQGRRKFVGGVENSAVKVHDCSLPSLNVTKSQTARPAAGQGTYQAELTYQDGVDAGGPDTQGFSAVLQHDGTDKALTGSQFTVDASGKATLSLSSLADGKYRVIVKAKAKNGKVSEATRLIFWIEAEAFSWNDAIIYMVMTDRYRDGDPSNNISSPTPNADPRGDFQNGDLQGVRQSIADGTLDKLGVRAIWLSPFGTNPDGAYLAADGVHMVTGYHGYWPVKGREVDKRWGGDDALKAMVVEAHKHGIRILQDYVIHHVHSEHEYVKAHPEWFILNGCVCGTNNCDWTEHALDCKFTDYLPNIDHTNPDANAAFNADAAWWLDTFDLDGFRIDAVKHVPEAATRNLAADVREDFEKAGTRHFLMGETAMGWNDCADPCNDENYDTISKYIGPLGLDGQIDFVLYHGVSYRTFAYSDKGFIHADYWTKHGLQKWGKNAIMTPYIGSQDTARFATLADYRGQDGAHDRGIPNNQWSNTAAKPTDSEPYRRTRIAMSWLLELPGAPLLYYGDEYGQWGGSDPNNRNMWRPEASLTADESATLAFVRKLGAARKTIPALRRGDYVSLYNTSEDTLVFGRSIASGNGAVVALTRLGTAQTVMVDLGATMGFSAGTKLHDALGGPDVNVSGGQTSITIPASGAVILAP
ncbi:MAG: alpha-amylase family glycosyl hydrolase [Minicystis sp.]